MLNHIFNVGAVRVFLKKIDKDPSSFNLIKMLGLNITMTGKNVLKVKIFIQLVMYNGKLNRNYVSARVR